MAEKDLVAGTQTEQLVASLESGRLMRAMRSADNANAALEEPGLTGQRNLLVACNLK
ncbi:MAG: hypothetical protein R3D29_00980 [Nitratireductor sp.]